MLNSQVTKERIIATPKTMLSLPLPSAKGKLSDAAVCLYSILKYYGYEFREEEQEKQFLFDSDSDVMNVEDIVTWINSLTFDQNNPRRLIRAEAFRYLTISDLMTAIDKGIPVICPIQAWYSNDQGEFETNYDYNNQHSCGHYVIAAGYDEERLYFLDPATSDAYTFIPIDQFDRRWHDEIDGIRYIRTGIEVRFNEVVKKTEVMFRML